MIVTPLHEKPLYFLDPWSRRLKHLHVDLRKMRLGVRGHRSHQCSHPRKNFRELFHLQLVIHSTAPLTLSFRAPAEQFSPEGHPGRLKVRSAFEKRSVPPLRWERANPSFISRFVTDNIQFRDKEIPQRPYCSPFLLARQSFVEHLH